ncbi:CLUMA_CG001576, isoform A [Clunio marinus]|uniref:CLUMA_CG001576, isoform A n=1 Tax=Clunio marinus TaxID=568069 RepID=A0A1J1HID9_9DIPT|nr:CLUMA_CG001576, isoform A [Clunio marinus]
MPRLYITLKSIPTPSLQTKVKQMWNDSNGRWETALIIMTENEQFLGVCKSFNQPFLPFLINQQFRFFEMQIRRHRLMKA